MHRARLISLVVMAALSLECQQKSPTTPTPSDVTAGLTLASFQASEVGPNQTVCGSAGYVAIDQLVFDVKSTDLTDLVGAIVYQQDPGESQIQVGRVAACSSPQTPCGQDGITAYLCYANSTATSGTIRISARVVWSPQKTWNMSLQTATRQSNNVSAVITRPNELPSGDLAAVASLDCSRVPAGTTSAVFHFVVYSPGVPGRKIMLTWDVFSGGVRLSTHTSLYEEAAGLHSTTISGGITLGTGETQMVGTITEVDAAGNVLKTDSKTVTVN